MKGKKMHKKSVVVFDFDGVLTKGGEGLKQKAWDILALPFHPDNADFLAEKRLEFSKGNGSRYDILRETFERFCSDNVEILTAAYADCYNTIVHKLLEQSGMPEGTKETLKTLAKFHTLFVNSATPEKAVRESIEHFGIKHHFRGIFGQPISKVDNLARAQHLAEVDNEFMLFIGDGKSDAKAAEEFGCDFVGIPNDWNKWTTETVKFPLVRSIVELPQLLGL